MNKLCCLLNGVCWCPESTRRHRSAKNCSHYICKTCFIEVLFRAMEKDLDYSNKSLINLAERMYAIRQEDP